MTEALITAIALLCQLNGYTSTYQHNRQLECQQFYVECLTTNQYTLKSEPNADKLATCISLRKPLK